MKKFLILSVVLFFLFNNSKAQGEFEQLPDVQFASPNAAAFAKYIETPVSYYTGVPNISVPIYNLDVNGFKLPISLSYHSGGIKVRELESWVGLGWNLNVGGVITRIVKGKPDYYVTGIGNGKINFLDSSKDILQKYEMYGASATDMLNYEEKNEMFFNEYLRYDNNVPDVLKKDGTIDEYVFSFLGYSGKFVYSEASDRFVSNCDDVVIERSENGTGNGFVITDNTGNKYYFETFEITPFGKLSKMIHNLQCVSSYFLSKIKLYKSGKIIDFVYDFPVVSNVDFSGSTLSYLLQGYYKYAQLDNGSMIDGEFSHGLQSSQYDNCMGDMLGLEVLFDDFLSSGYLIQEEHCLLKEIKVGNTIIKFNREKEKLSVKDNIEVSERDVEKLCSIQVYKEGILCHATSFNYGYFVDNDGFKRVKLAEVSVNNKKYNFEYLESFQGKNLPSFESKGIDYWGYYNGADQNEDIAINIKDELIPSFNSSAKTHKAVRLANENFAKLGSLRKIEYPTGGYDLFDYESNTYSNLYYNGYSIDNDALDFISTEKEFNVHLENEIEYKYYERIYQGALGEYPGNVNVLVDYTIANSSEHERDLTKQTEITISSPQTIDISTKYSLNINMFPWAELGIDPGYYYYLLQSAFSEDNFGYSRSLVINIKKFNEQTGNWELYKTLYDISTSDFYMFGEEKKISIYCDVGKYMISISRHGIFSGASLSFSYKFGENTSSYHKIGGGLRIKSFQKFDKNNEKLLHKEYLYHNEGDVSWGVLETPFANCKANFNYNVKDAIGGDPRCYKHAKLLYLNVCENSLIPFSGKTQTSIGYERVVERDMLDNGCVKYFYTTGKDYPDLYQTDDYYVDRTNYNEEPIALAFSKTDYKLTLFKELDNSARRGLLTRKEVYDSKGVIVKKEELNYVTRDSKSGNIYRAFFTPDWDYSMRTLIQTYAPFYPLLKEKRITDYFNGDSIVSNTDYTYNATYPFVATESYEDKGKNYKKEYTYVDSNPLNNSLLSELKDKNIVKIPIKIVNSIDSRETYSQERNFARNNDVILPNEIKERINGKEIPLTNIEYDSLGNIKKISKKDGTYEYYIWAYNGQYPIVKILSSQDFNISVTLDEGLLNKTDIEADVKADINYLKAQLSSYMLNSNNHVSIYTYKPLIGMTSETDKNGNTVFYKYDTYGRLLTIKDDKGNIVKSYKYNYRKNVAN